MRQFSMLILVGSILVSCKSKPPDLKTDIVTPVTVEEVRPRHIERFITATGTVYPTKEALLKSELRGAYKLQINPKTKRAFALGDKVKKGQIVITLQDKEFENGVQLKSKTLSLKSSERTFKKQKSLYTKGAVTLSDLKAAEKDQLNANYAYEKALLDLGKMNVRAPFDGIIVGLPYFTPGVKIDAGLEVMKVMNYSTLRLEVQLPEKHLLETRPGIISRITNYTIKEEVLTGKITQVSPVINKENRSFQAVINIDNPGEILRPGMFVKAEIVMEEKDSTVVIAKSIILSNGKNSIVYAVNKGVAQEKRLALGLDNPDSVEVTSGLRYNDRLIISGFETLRNGSSVEVTR